MSTPENLRYKYPLDLSGISQNNRVTDETHTLTTDFRVVFPKEGAFFTQNFVVRLGNRTLERNVDYKFYVLHTEASKETNLEVCSALNFINPAVTGTITIEYNVVGGRYCHNENSTRQILAIKGLDSRKVKWEHIANKPTLYHPACHVHHMTDIFGLGPMVQYLALIYEAIQNLRLANNTGIWKQIAYMYNRQNEFIRKVEEKFNPVIETIENFRVQFSGANVPVKKSEYDIKIAEIEGNVNAAEGRVAELIRIERVRVDNHDTLIGGLRTEVNELKPKVTAIETKLRPTENPYTLTYTGEYSAYMTLTRQKNLGWKIEYNDSPKLKEALTRIGILETAKTEIGDAVEELNTKFETEKRRYHEEDKPILNKISGIETKQRSEETRLSEFIRTNTALIENTSRDLTGRLATLENGFNTFKQTELATLVNPMITAITSPISDRINATNREVARVEGLITPIRTNVTNLQRDLSAVQSSIDTKINDAKAQIEIDRTEALRPVLNRLTTLETTTVSGINDRISRVSDSITTITNTTLPNKVAEEIRKNNENFVKVEDNKIRKLIEDLRIEINSSSTQQNNSNEALGGRLTTVEGSLRSLTDTVTRNNNAIPAAIDAKINAFAGTPLEEKLQPIRQSVTDVANRVTPLETNLRNLTNNLNTTITNVATPIVNQAKQTLEAKDNKIEEWVRLSRTNRVTHLELATNANLQWIPPSTTHASLNNHASISHTGLYKFKMTSNQNDHIVTQRIPVFSQQQYEVMVDVELTNATTDCDFILVVSQYNHAGSTVSGRWSSNVIPLYKMKSRGNQWVTLRGVIKPNFADTKVDNYNDGNNLTRGTSFIEIGVRTIINQGSTDQNSFVHMTTPRIRVMDPPIDLDNIPGFNQKVRQVLNVMIREQQQLPEASRWDLSRLRIQPGAEAFSSVTLDENDNLNVRGIVLYDTLGTGQRSIFAPTNVINVTQSQTWNVPSQYDKRQAKITVRANARVNGSSITMSAVREMFVTLEGGTSINIVVGDISSFGSFLTVSNGIDYADAIYPRVTVTGSTPQSSLNGLVSITV